MKFAARGSLEIQDAKIMQKIIVPLSSYIFTTKARIDNRKKLVKQQYLLQMSLQYGEPQPTNS